MSSRKGFEGDFAVGSVTGLRTWNLGKHDGMLHGAWDTWQPGENIAECKGAGGHDVPCEPCGCGFWAYWHRAAAGEVHGEHLVIGVIEGYGGTLIGDLGFRCAKARIVALHCTFKIMVEEQPLHSKAGLWTPEPGMFRRGPGGMDTFNAFAGRENPRMVEDHDALMKVQNILETIYDVPVYTSLEAMMLRHPTTKDYL